jgi:hypothetical protein
MIKIVTGVVGSGKTLSCAMEIFDVLCSGRTVATNVQLVWEELADLALRERGVILNREQVFIFDPEVTPDWHRHVPWGLPGAPVEVYLDEIHLFANARDWAETAKNSRSLLSFLSQSRKAHMNITFIVQEVGNLDKQYRVLAEWEYYCVSTAHIPLGILGRLPITAFVVVVRDAQNGKFNRRIWKSYDKRFFRCYKSHSFLNAEMAKLAEGAKRAERFTLARIGWFHRQWLRVVHDWRSIVAALRPLLRFITP